MTNDNATGVAELMEDDPFRRSYRELTDKEKLAIDAIKAKASELLHLIREAYDDADGQMQPEGTDDAYPGLESVVMAFRRELASAEERLEEAVMWAVKGLTA